MLSIRLETEDWRELLASRGLKTDDKSVDLFRHQVLAAYPMPYRREYRQSVGGHVIVQSGAPTEVAAFLESISNAYLDLADLLSR